MEEHPLSWRPPPPVWSQVRPCVHIHAVNQPMDVYSIRHELKHNNGGQVLSLCTDQCSWNPAYTNTHIHLGPIPMPFSPPGNETIC